MEAREVTWHDFGPQLVLWRTEAALSQERLAEELACSQNYIWRLEKGLRHPSKFLLRALAQIFALAPDECALLAAFEQLVVSHATGVRADEIDPHIMDYYVRACQPPIGRVPPLHHISAGGDALHLS